QEKCRFFRGGVEIAAILAAFRARNGANPGRAILVACPEETPEWKTPPRIRRQLRRLVCGRFADRWAAGSCATLPVPANGACRRLPMQLKIAPIATATARAVRQTLKAPGYGFPAHREAAAGRAPCRHCLRLIRPGVEELILFTYDAFAGLGVPP